MTIILVLGLFAGFAILSLLLRLAIHALPLYVGLALGFWLHGHAHSWLTAIGGGFLAGAATLAVGQTLFATARSPAMRLGIAAAFVVPAGFAGYQAVHGLAGLAFGASPSVTVISLIGGVVIASLAWSQLGGAGQARPFAPEPLQSGNAN